LRCQGCERHRKRCDHPVKKLINLVAEADTDGNGLYSAEELNALTKAQIADLASGLGYEGISTNLTKAQMIEAFLTAQGGD